MRRRFWLSLFVGWMMVMSSLAFAARPGRIDVEGAELFEGPGRGYSVLEKLSRGTPVTTSNYPTEGFYKVRTGSGMVGWVSVDSIVIEDLPDVTEVKPELNTQSAADPSNPWRGKAPTAVPSDFRNKRYGSFLRVRAFGGMDFFNAADVNQFLSFGAIKNGFHYGGEVNFRFTRDLSMIARAEEMSKSIVGYDSASDEVFQIEASAIPVMVGLELTLTEETNFSSFFGVMAGVGLNTLLKSSLIKNSGGTTQFLSQNFTGMARLLFAYHATKMFHVYVDASYRYLKTKAQTPSTIATGSEIWQKDSAYYPLTIDLSGPSASAGIAINF